MGGKLLAGRHGADDESTGTQHALDFGQGLSEDRVAEMFQNLGHDHRAEEVAIEGKLLGPADADFVAQSQLVLQAGDGPRARIDAVDACSPADQLLFEITRSDADVQHRAMPADRLGQMMQPCTTAGEDFDLFDLDAVPQSIILFQGSCDVGEHSKTP